MVDFFKNRNKEEAETKQKQKMSAYRKKLKQKERQRSPPERTIRRGHQILHRGDRGRSQKPHFVQQSLGSLCQNGQVPGGAFGRRADHRDKKRLGQGIFAQRSRARVLRQSRRGGDCLRGRPKTRSQ